MFNGSPEEQRAAAEKMNTLYEFNRWKPSVGRIMPLAETAMAHQLQEENTVQKRGTLLGKIVLTP
jgi:NADPH2:quinone reductase